MNQLIFIRSMKLDRYLFLTLLFASIILTTACQGPKKWAARLDSTIYQSWVHTFEEDTNTEKVFRPTGYPLPPARGREGIEFQRGGKVIYRAIGPVDLPVQYEGSWTMTDKNTMQVQIPDYSDQSQSFRITSLEKDRLVIAQ